MLDHEGSTDNRGWKVYRPFPADREGTDCFVQLTPDSDTFTDCDGRVLDVAELRPAPEVKVIIENEQTLLLQFPGAVAS